MVKIRILKLVLVELFPDGPADPNLVRELAPDGWEKCGLVRICHPTPPQVLKSPSLHRLRSLAKPVQPERECAEILGLCLRDVFGEHDVMGEDEAGEAFWVEDGTWRATSDDIAEWLNRYVVGRAYSYIDFYMGSGYVENLADLRPVFDLIFRRFQELGLEMFYTYPSWFDAHNSDDREGYLQLKAEKDQPGTTLEQLLGEQAPPPILSAYFSVFGRPPKMADY